LVTVVLAIVGAENGSTLAAFTVAPSNAVGSVPTSSSSWVFSDLSDVARNAAVACAIVASLSSGSAVVVSSR